MVFADHERYTFDEIMVDLDAAHILGAGFRAVRRQIVRVGDLAIRVGGHWKLSGAIIRVRRELIEPGNAVGRDANDGGAGSIEFIFLLRERMSLDRKSTRLNSSHMSISYAVFCLKK